MKVLFKNTTEYTKENYNEFVKFHQEKFGVKTIIKLAVFCLCIIYIFIANLINLNWKLLGILVFVGICVYIVTKIRLNTEVQDRKKNIKRKKKFTFYFYENFIKVKSGKKSQRIMYFELYKIFQTEEYFFLYTDEDHSLILNKKGFEIGTPQGFELFIKKKCPLKYKK